jgi:transcriptional regulator with XRE-family HTH domain
MAALIGVGKLANTLGITARAYSDVEKGVVEPPDQAIIDSWLAAIDMLERQRLAKYVRS